MKLTEKLDILMAERGITRGRLAEETGIPYNTLVGYYTRGYSNVKLTNLTRLCSYFGVTLDELCDDARELGGEERKLGAVSERYASLSDGARSIVDGVIDGLIGLESPARGPAEKKITYIREYVTPAAAGYASPAEGEDYTLVVRPDDAPKNADFLVRIDGDSMEPYIKNGSRVYVSRSDEVRDGDIGIFFVDGDMKCKQYCRDVRGSTYLFSLNRRRRDADVEIPASSGVTICCFGKVLLGRRVPLPND